MPTGNRPGLKEKSGLITEAGGTSPMHMALTEAGTDLKNYPGKTAVVIISDGQEAVGLTSPITLTAAQALKDQLGPGLCFYPVFIADDQNGRVLMDKIARIGECGFVSEADTLLTGSGMAAFVRDVFLTRKPMAPKDSDNDGVTDNLDKCPGTPKGVKVDADGCPKVVKAAAPPIMAALNSKGAWVVDEAYFDFDKAAVKKEAFDFLDKIAEFLKASPETFVKIQGHTDSVGTKAYNDILSLQRAQAVQTYLTDRGVDKSRLTCEGLGFSKPVASNKTDKGRAMNRRVELYPEK